jgi:hypothetical protein
LSPFIVFDRDAQLVRHVDHGLRHVDVVVVARDRLAVGHQAAVHHHRRKTQVDRALAHVGALAMVLVHHQRHARVLLDRCQDQVLDERLARILARAGAGLQDHRRAGFLRGRHHGLHLFEVVDVERRDAVAVLGGVVQQLAHGDEGHGGGSR